MKCTQYHDDNIHPSVVQTNLKTPFMRTVTYLSCFFFLFAGDYSGRPVAAKNEAVLRGSPIWSRTVCSELLLPLARSPSSATDVSLYCWVISGLHCGSVCKQHASLSDSAASDNKVMQYLQARIKANGPITVAEYMKTVLTSAESVGIIIY